ncbi:hypothetical protein BO71DRAFT_219472 [Aspergillus ellipticus CBS 707.79]|uniref:Uncharacterized protein n=1 Tax=Aspergillus ellipticus CBS 707.79 TaxID=1448320 RepID=A0A319E2P9_9EURO|nr:hypothetical protein BO71DRAFT_219472 [Aspergillus ellipticus CBS 707.79]
MKVYIAPDPSIVYDGPECTRLQLANPGVKIGCEDSRPATPTESQERLGDFNGGLHTDQTAHQQTAPHPPAHHAAASGPWQGLRTKNTTTVGKWMAPRRTSAREGSFGYDTHTPSCSSSRCYWACWINQASEPSGRRNTLERVNRELRPPPFPFSHLPCPVILERGNRLLTVNHQNH